MVLRVAAATVKAGINWLQLHGPIVIVQRAGKIVFPRLQFAAVEPGIGVIGIHTNHSFEIGLGSLCITASSPADAAIVHGAPVRGVQRSRRIEIFEGRLFVPVSHIFLTTLVVSPGL